MVLWHCNTPVCDQTAYPTATCEGLPPRSRATCLGHLRAVLIPGSNVCYRIDKIVVQNCGGGRWNLVVLFDRRHPDDVLVDSVTTPTALAILVEVHRNLVAGH